MFDFFAKILEVKFILITMKTLRFSINSTYRAYQMLNRRHFNILLLRLIRCAVVHTSGVATKHTVGGPHHASDIFWLLKHS